MLSDPSLNTGILLYIDPGTGSMLFALLIGIISTFTFLFRKTILALKFRLSGGKTDASVTSDRIDFVIFSDNKRYWNVFKPICDEFEKRGIAESVYYWTASPDDPALNEHYEHVKCEFIGEGNHAFARLNMMDAGICLSTTPGLDVYQWKRSKGCRFYAHIMHSLGDGTGYRMFGLDFFDAVMLCSDYARSKLVELEDLRGLPAKELPIVGCTYMDEMQKRYDHMQHAERPDFRTVLLAPSWGKESILSTFGERLIDALLHTNFHIIIRPHPQSMSSEKEQMEKLMNEYPDSDRLEWNFDLDNYAVLDRSDILISDYSSVIFDYTLIFNRPILFMERTIDNSAYDSAWLEEPMFIPAICPKLGMPIREEDLEDLQPLIENTITSKIFENNRSEVRDMIWQNIGNCAEASVDYLIKKHRELTAVSEQSQEE